MKLFLFYFFFLSSAFPGLDSPLSPPHLGLNAVRRGKRFQPPSSTYCKLSPEPLNKTIETELLKQGKRNEITEYAPYYTISLYHFSVCFPYPFAGRGELRRGMRQKGILGKLKHMESSGHCRFCNY